MAGERIVDIDWDDLKCFLALAETGQLTGAGARLGISQPTMGRRLKQLENCLGTKRAERVHDKYVLTPSGELVYELAKEMQQSVYAIERNTIDKDADVAGRITLSTTSCIASAWLVAQLKEFLDKHPRVEVELVIGLDLLSLRNRQADIALRVGTRGPEDLVGKRAGVVNFGLYASQDYLRARGRPQRPEDLARHEIIDSLGALAQVTQVGMLRELAHGARTPIGSDSILAQLRAARKGIGIVALPHYLVVASPELVRVLEQDFDIALDLWLLIHRDLTTTPRYSVCFQYLLTALQRHAQVFAGPPAPGRGPGDISGPKSTARPPSPAR